MLFASTLWGYLTPPDEQKSAPLFVKYTMSVWYIIQPMSFIVTILYWTIVNEFWDPYPMGFASYWAHLFNCMVLIVILLVSRLPFSLKNGILALELYFHLHALGRHPLFLGNSQRCTLRWLSNQRMSNLQCHWLEWTPFGHRLPRGCFRGAGGVTRLSVAVVTEPQVQATWRKRTDPHLESRYESQTWSNLIFSFSLSLTV